ncbi:hypothetical protein PHLCEN_2v6310 [Hermanssonia centrifuga]|uniref:Uncharacterized protein n=1 Tax=Hermanssonia centrifuga TaxID=98765 RepID=A0A2R6NZS9_9APHY|nr:hypothetical protein PHLCEN_2v6310 [Hermanssonia centrifuga]
MTADNINIGLGALLETFEMMLFAFLHIKAFTYKPYRTPPYRTRRLRALGHAFDFRETLRELWAGMIYMVNRTKGRETDAEARRQAVLEGVFGRSRIQIRGSAKLQNEGPQLGAVEKGELFVGGAVEETAHIGEERQWLGVGETYGDGLGYHSRRTKEKSEDLGQQIEKELAKRGYSRRRKF